ncbi:MAG: hypothetical protein WD876_03220 [Candidatus Pacearchaeota archaeon]
MAEMTSGLIYEIINAYGNFLGTLPDWGQNFLNLFLLVIFITGYLIFIWKLYRFIATKNVLDLDLNKYNKSNHPLTAKVLAGGLYFLEYVIILPFIIFFWFSVFTLFLILLTKDIEIGTILVISAVIISSIRMASYYKEDLAKETAKLLPFTLLAIVIVTPGFFDFERIIGNFSEIPMFFSSVFVYLFFIISLEIVLRFFDFIFSLFGLEEEGEEKEAE